MARECREIKQKTKARMQWVFTQKNAVLLNEHQRYPIGPGTKAHTGSASVSLLEGPHKMLREKKTSTAQSILEWKEATEPSEKKVFVHSDFQCNNFQLDAITPIHMQQRSAFQKKINIL